MVYAVLLAGGLGKRVGSNLPKQHIVVDNFEIIEYTIKAFYNCEMIDSIIIVSNKEYLDHVELLKTKYKRVKGVLVGGDTRTKSVFSAISFLAKTASNNDKILISDAARPLITKRELKELIEKLDSFSAATTFIKCNETLFKNVNGSVDQIIYRDGIIRQTSPEGYRFATLKWLYLGDDHPPIDNYKNIGLDQLFSCGVSIGLVESNNFNFKITTKEDINLFETFLKTGFERIINS